MIKRELLAAAPGSVKYIVATVIIQLVRLVGNMAMVFTVAWFLRRISEGAPLSLEEIWPRALAILALGALRWGATYGAARTSHFASADAKRALRRRLYEKLICLGPGYTEKVSTGEAVQVCVEGIDQLETYFGRYLPQFFYALLAPLILFGAVAPLSLRAAIALFICVPLIPLAIVLVQKLAKNLLRKYWGRYTRLGDTFLENMQGLTALKIYGADEQKHREMNEKAEEFRDITMKVLTMQLNSIIIMDTVAYGGAALGIILAVSEALAGKIALWQAFVILMLSADFFLPMRTLGSYFHVAMNGMAASDKMFAMLRLDEEEQGAEAPGFPLEMAARDLTFTYDGETDALSGVSFDLPAQGITAIVGESGCGKSTLAGLLSGGLKGYFGSLTLGGKELYDLSDESLFRTLTLVSAGDYIFSGTVRENLRMGKAEATEEEMEEACRRARLWDWLAAGSGLDTPIENDASNLSGGQRQRLAVARALLRDTPMYIFDEATSNIDAESEAAILEAIYGFRGKKTVLMITHRLENAVGADRILVLDRGRVAGLGDHETLLKTCPEYQALYTGQAEMEKYAKGGARA
ncbi:MAG: ABC transporter ATP-binding protein/permease [Clostridia bacterium]|nr:ABC transporter ATP-binding protein/permease [Clostridia bacterium]